MIANDSNAIDWIIGIIDELDIPYQLSGGLAAKFYGSPRPVNDIDIDIPRKSFEVLYQRVQEYVVKEPDLWQDEEWKVFMMILKYKGQNIDICSADDQEIFNFQTKEWMQYTYVLSNVNKMLFDGRIYCVINPQLLSDYKQNFKWAKHKLDIYHITKYLNDNSKR